MIKNDVNSYSFSHLNTKSIFKQNKFKKSCPLQPNDIDMLLNNKLKLSNFVIEAYLSTIIKAIIVNSVAAHSILINKQYTDDLLNEVFSNKYYQKNN